MKPQTAEISLAAVAVLAVKQLRRNSEARNLR
jgi:hypothetical protein